MKLTQKEENYVQYLFGGLSQRKAYRKAFTISKKWKDHTVDTRACELAGKSKITGRLSDLRKKAEDESVKSFIQKRIMLAERMDEGLDTEGLRALDIDNKMAGHYAEDNKREIVVSLESNILNDLNTNS